MHIEKNSLMRPLNNLEKVAGDLQAYILNIHNKDAIYKAIEEVENEYRPWFYNIYRRRATEINEIKNKVRITTNSVEVLYALVMFFQNGGWESTSANTLLMSKLTKQLVNYDWESEKRSALWTDPQISKRLCLLFLDHARPMLVNKRVKTFQEKLVMERKNDLKKLPSHNIKKRQEEIKEKLNNTESVKGSSPKKLSKNEGLRANFNFIEGFFKTHPHSKPSSLSVTQQPDLEGFSLTQRK